MSVYPADLKYDKEHEWVRVEGDTATIGISDFAQDQLGEVVYVDLPSVGDELVAGETFGEIESVKAVSDLYSPVDGEVAAANTVLADNLEHLADDPYQNGWFIKIKITDEAGLANLLDEAAYKKQCEEEQH